MNIIENIIETTIESFDFSFCIAVNILTYIIIKIVDEANGTKRLSTWTKRIILLICLGIVSIVYYSTGSSIKLVANSAILAPVFWSWIFKPICKYFNIDYKQFNIED